jgi:undecaprenyl-diphosphatase
MYQQLIDLDRDLFVFLNNAGNTSWDAFFLTVTLSSLWIPLFSYFIFLTFISVEKNRFYNTIWTAFLMILTVALVGFFVKYTVARPRPHQLLDMVHDIRALKPISGYSFFSGHAASSFAIVTFLYLLLRKIKPWVYLFYAWAFLYSYSRIYIGVHYPLDSIAGALTGSGFAYLFYSWLAISKRSFFNPFK